MLIEPTAAMSCAKIVATTSVALVNCVGRSTPFTRATTPLTKLAPVMVSGNDGPPTITELGLRLVKTGMVVIGGLSVITPATYVVGRSLAALSTVSRGMGRLPKLTVVELTELVCGALNVTTRIRLAPA